MRWKSHFFIFYLFNIVYFIYTFAKTQIKIQEYKLSSAIKETKSQLAQLNSQIGNYKNLKSLNDKNIYYAEKEIDLLKSQVQIGRATISDIISAVLPSI